MYKWLSTRYQLFIEGGWIRGCPAQMQNVKLVEIVCIRKYSNALFLFLCFSKTFPKNLLVLTFCMSEDKATSDKEVYFKSFMRASMYNSIL